MILDINRQLFFQGIGNGPQQFLPVATGYAGGRQQAIAARGEHADAQAAGHTGRLPQCARLERAGRLTVRPEQDPFTGAPRVLADTQQQVVTHNCFRSS
jgi:hypothetical protein